ncbi:hypothetical protein, conserved [Eimeria brunetti]|uniref:SET domain-containing protein n=1 Tax=Eimeria brunetti TaxID=51314 RepID=U6LQ24_9EIME|nr:hypothetical protein, conserved [Eimeria brunetti]
MATSLLFHHLQHVGLPALQQLQEHLCTPQPEDGVAQGRSSTNSAAVDNKASGHLSSSSSRGCNSHAESLAQRIISLSTPLSPPPPPYSVDTNGVLRSACSLSPNPCNSNRSSCSSSSTEAASEEGVSSIPRSIFSIDSVGLASAVFVPSLHSVFRELWEASGASDWLLPAERPSTPRFSVNVEVWKLRPSAELSGQLKLWGNAALARGRAAAAAALYTAGMLLLPSNSNTTNSNGLLAVLCANASLALLRLGLLRRALRTATEAVAADPMYRKAWHRRAAALAHLRETVERHFSAVRFSISRTRSSGGSTGHNAEDCTAPARACLQQIDREIAEAQMMYQGQADASKAAAAASRMKIGCCGCGCKAAPLPCKGNDAVPDPPGLWLRGDVSAQLGAKGWGLVTANDALSRLEDDPCLVLEEQAFAVYVHPNLCATVPKIPFSLASQKFAPTQNPGGLQLHADATVRDAWENRVEEGVAGKEGGEGKGESEKGEQDACPELQEATEGICAGCATQQQHLQQQDADGMEIRTRSSENIRGTGEAAAESIPDTAVQVLALALPDPHRCIARQLLASVLPPAAAVPERADEISSATTAEAPIQAAVDSSNAPNSAGLSLLRDPPWRQLLMRTSSVVVDRTRVADWLLNAAFLAGEAAASGRGMQPWCPKCPLRPSAEQNNDSAQRCGIPFPKCLFAAALHVYGVASCNSFTIRVSCDPEEEAFAAGTALFLVASLLNHSCSPNAIAAFGEPQIQLQHQQQRHHNMLDQHQREENVDCAVAQPAYLLSSPHGIGRGALLQACVPPPGGSSAAGVGDIAFRSELLCGFPCPLCTSISCAREFLGAIQQDNSSEQECRALFDTAALLKRCLGPHLNEAEAFPDPPARMSSFIGKNTPFYAFSELCCLSCSSRFAAIVLEREREAVHVHLDRKLSALRKLVSPSSRVTITQRGELLTAVLKDILHAIPHVIAVSGCLSTDVWQALQSAARAAHTQGSVMRQAHADCIGSVDSVSMAATCLSAGIYVLLQRLPLGLSQPEVSSHMYKAAVLLGQVGDRAQAKQILKTAIKATLKSCGPHSVTQSCLEGYLRWLEGENE